MTFLSVTFLLFLAASLVLYYLLPKKFQWIILLAAGAVFYLWGGVKTAGYLAFSIAVTYAAGLGLEALNHRRGTIPKDDKARLDANKRARKAVCAAAILLNFGMLYMLKYFGFTEEIVVGLVRALGGSWNPPTVSFLLPLGVSFYVFQSTGYVIDQYRGKYPAEHNPAKFALFVSFFPQMVQGPISRFDSLAPQLFGGHDLRAENLRDGILRFMWGCFKKMVIADRAAVAVSAFFAESGAYSGSVTAFSVLLYCINLYADFSGGIDMTVGAARMFGTTLDENFRRPIFATSLSEYWRRWHITLGGWMRDYVFYPLSLSPAFTKLGRWGRKHLGGRVGKILHTSAATFVVYFLIGLWHGANFRYIAYGFLNGFIITSSLLLADVYADWRKKLHVKADSTGWRLFGMARTSLIVFFGRYITRSPRLLTAFSLIGRTFADFRIGDLFSGVPLSLGLGVGDYLIIALSTAAVLVVEYIEEKHDQPMTDVLAEQSGLVQWIVMAALMTALLLFGIFRGSYIASEFIYMQY